MKLTDNETSTLLLFGAQKRMTLTTEEFSKHESNYGNSLTSLLGRELVTRLSDNEYGLTNHGQEIYQNFMKDNYF